MGVFVLDSGAVTALAAASTRARAWILELTAEGHWPPRVPSVVLVECLAGHPGRDANVNRFLKTCTIVPLVPELVARRAARLRTAARRGSAVDALVVAYAEPGGVVLTADMKDIKALAAHAEGVAVERI